ncbi:hypothetical protein EVAR_91236_1 [Eumeta japonica]|uniref:Uncharacterized protein n=1 Tax=Eumeta variegata TaxID=151549 RepID=A0A4C1ZZY4_EUMVA|nr:hypothetical protein EVAR_91236_1 [Eumeta japonica]
MVEHSETFSPLTILDASKTGSHWPKAYIASAQKQLYYNDIVMAAALVTQNGGTRTRWRARGRPAVTTSAAGASRPASGTSQTYIFANFNNRYA